VDLSGEWPILSDASPASNNGERRQRVELSQTHRAAVGHEQPSNLQDDQTFERS
jgi:hypothetical protein